MLKSNATRIHFHAGHNDAGYLPESEVETFDTFEDAKAYMISELLSAADNMASWADEHDCDDVPCPTYGDACPEQLASEATALAEDLNLDSGPEWNYYLSDGRALPVYYWIQPCTETVCSPDPSEDTARRIASDWHGGQSSALYSFASTGHIAADLWAEIRREVTDEADRSYLLAFLGDELDEDLSDRPECLTADECEARGLDPLIMGIGPDCQYAHGERGLPHIRDCWPTDGGSVPGWACSDCLMLIANGETPPELDEDETAAFVARFEAHTDGYWVAYGDETQDFSWRQCDTCGTFLGGSRHAVTLFPRDGAK
jgi:hypothetical protein